MITPSDLAAWGCYEDTIRRLLPFLALPAIVQVAGDLRPGCGGPWQELDDPLEARRLLLLADVTAQGALLLGEPWPVDQDLLSTAPDDLSQLDDGL